MHLLETLLKIPEKIPTSQVHSSYNYTYVLMLIIRIGSLFQIKIKQPLKHEETSVECNTR